MRTNILSYANFICIILLIASCDFSVDPDSSGRSACSIDMVEIPAGTFLMGNTGDYEGYGDEKTIHRVTISYPFLMSKYEIVQKQYSTVMGRNPSEYHGRKRPVEEVSWFEAVVFCNKLSAIDSLEKCYTFDSSGNEVMVSCDFDANGYRLPTEAEWEYACKGVTKTDFYNGDLTGKIIDSHLHLIGWYWDNSDRYYSSSDSGHKTHEVGQKEPNAFGLYDMSGNVWEWCWDWYDENYYANSPDYDPRGPDQGYFRVLRGGSWRNNAHYCRSSRRDHGFPYTSISDANIGFRIVRKNRKEN